MYWENDIEDIEKAAQSLEMDASALNEKIFGPKPTENSLMPMPHIRPTT